MLNNVKIKKLLKETVFKPISLLNRFIPKNDRIILLHSSVHGIIFNLKPVKQYLLENHYDDKYHIICSIENMNYADQDTDRVTYVGYMKAIFYFLRAKHVFYTAGQIPVKPSKTQMVIFFDHGTAAFKTGGALTAIGNGDEFFFSYILAPSPLYVPILQKEYLCRKENILISGEPMTDTFYKPVINYDLGNYEKILLWLPTFRQSAYLNYDDSSESVLPMFDVANYAELNSRLKQYNFKLIVKPHPMQDLNSLKGLNEDSLSNIDIISDEAFTKRGFDLYELMKQCDALIGDYSSVSMQYLHLDRPLAFVIPDIDEYKQKRGFLFENPEDYMAGSLIKTREELYRFFEELAAGADPYCEKRAWVRSQIYTYTDGKDTERALKISGITKN